MRVRRISNRESAAWSSSPKAIIERVYAEARSEYWSKHSSDVCKWRYRNDPDFRALRLARAYIARETGMPASSFPEELVAARAEQIKARIAVREKSGSLRKRGAKKPRRKFELPPYHCGRLDALLGHPQNSRSSAYREGYESEIAQVMETRRAETRSRLRAKA